MISKVTILAPEETEKRLDSMADRFRVTLSFKPKENAVKQELERANEASKGVLRVTLVLNAAFPTIAVGGKGQQTWKGYWEWVRKDFGRLVQEVEEEGRQ